MKKIWSYIALFFVGLSAGLLVAVKTAGDDYKAYISKVKSKGKSTQDVVFKPILGTSEAKAGKPLSERKRKRIEKIKKKAEERLEL